ncbi:30S ribosomal protein S8 [Aminiphilus sp.]|jgi:small subunit ribosomal protein S8|uniref:30S ribosomal protein S8 n=1 Tax=Aminiphilus sp. TaxID=1872488 RepID=UPI002617C588|nr:30S ribosomal protein S8 [Aminiphilus sp.]
MYVNDPIADMLTRIRNANMVYLDVVDMPLSRVKAAIAKILKEEGYIRNYKVINDPKKPFQVLRIFMQYGSNREHVVQGIKRISKPGRRVYAGSKELPKVMGGLGMAVVSTSQGLMTDAEARKRGLGGEILCNVW